jgi:hypothetical protein
MSGFTSIFGSSGVPKDAPLSTSTSSTSNAEIKRQLQQQISQELAIANATELVNVRRICCRVRVEDIHTDPENNGELLRQVRSYAGLQSEFGRARMYQKVHGEIHVRLESDLSDLYRANPTSGCVRRGLILDIVHSVNRILVTRVKSTPRP